MRQLTFLQADRPLTKTYYADGKSDPYPLVRDFTSTQVGYETIEDFFEIIQLVADANGCLLKGHLTRKIDNEPRAGLTDPSANTDYLVIDYDTDEGFESIEDMLGEIDPVLCTTDYVFQHSASSGIKGASGLRGHVFILLTEPVAPSVLKQWLKKVNLTSSRFRRKVKLSRNAMSLCYALDITVNQNDKLIYVAKPQLDGIEDPIAERFTLHKKDSRSYTYDAPISVELNRSKEHELIAELQDKLGIQKRVPKYGLAGDIELLLNPASCTVTGHRQTGQYMRLNLNGGDSWAYWYHVDNPEILYNYKGEPSVYLKDVAPDYYAQTQRKRGFQIIRPIVFRDMTTDTYFNAEYNEEQRRVINCHRVKNKTTLADFMLQRGAPAPKVIPDWIVKFDPTDYSAVDFSTKTINLFSPTKYMDEVAMSEINTELSHDSFPTIHKVLSHLCVDTPTYEHFLRWLGHIMQFRTKTQTAWLFSGTEGTGKGLMFEYILKPLFGREHCFLVGQETMDDQYNAYLEKNLILFLDEGNIESSRQAEKLMAKLRTTITEKTIPMRSMRTNVIQIPSFTNVIVATNKSMAVRLQQGDRRWNVAPRQYEKLRISREEVEEKIAMELGAFATHLRSLAIEHSDCIKLIDTEAKVDLLELSKTVSDDFFTAFKMGDLDFFAERLQESVPVGDPAYIGYAKIVTDWMRHTNKIIRVPIDDLLQVYKYIGGNESMTPKRFGHAASRHELRSVQVRIEGIQRRVYEVKFEDRGYDAWLDRNNRASSLRLVKEQSNVVPVSGTQAN